MATPRSLDGEGAGGTEQQSRAESEGGSTGRGQSRRPLCKVRCGRGFAGSSVWPCAIACYPPFRFSHSPRALGCVVSLLPRSHCLLCVLLRSYIEFHEPQRGRSQHFRLEVGGRQLHHGVAGGVQAGASGDSDGAERQGEGAYEGAEQERGAHGGRAGVWPSQQRRVSAPSLTVSPAAVSLRFFPRLCWLEARATRLVCALAVALCWPPLLLCAVRLAELPARGPH